MIIKSLRDFKIRLQAGFDKNEDSLEKFGKTYSKQLKAYLIESNHDSIEDISPPLGNWESLDKKGWYRGENSDFPNSIFINTIDDRVWILYSLLDAKRSDYLMDNWLKENKGLDRCWLSREHLLHWENEPHWDQRGIGLKFLDGLTPEEKAGNFSLKAWHGADRYVEGLDQIIENAKKNFAIYSLRWQKKEKGHISISSEWYSDGKVTINRADDVDEVLLHISKMANKYSNSIKEATELRNKTMGAFELDFSQEIDLDAFSETVLKGIGNMKLWLIEIESQDDFKRYKGLDLHTWDRILIDVGLDYAYLTVPGKGCINAAPRIAVIQGEDNAGKTKIYHDGVEVFV